MEEETMGDFDIVQLNKYTKCRELRLIIHY